MGIEPTSEAWEASILPLYDARLPTKLAKAFRTRKYRDAFSFSEPSPWTRENVIGAGRLSDADVS
jgi:hypothetical protein